MASNTNTMSKVIVSSYSLFDFLRNIYGFKDKDEIITITGNREKSEIMFSTGTRFNCEVQKDFEFQTNVYHLTNLREVLGKVTDQPITIEFAGHKYITIKHIEV